MTFENEFEHDDLLDVRDLADKVRAIDFDEEEREDAIEVIAGYAKIVNDLRWDSLADKPATPEDPEDEEYEFIQWRDEVASELERLGYDGDATLIRDTYFVEAMEELVKDIGDLPQNVPTYLEIDWQKTAENLRVDYTSVDIAGTEYWTRRG